MIDFRYHLVSLVSVFVALAVGIVLGAGPLRGQIAEGLNRQVDQLSSENRALNTEKNTALKAAANRDTFVQGLLPTLAAQQLTGRSLVLVTLPASDPDAVKPLTQAVRAAGATLTLRVDVLDAWTSADTLALRQRLAERWKSVLSSSSAPTTGSSPVSVATRTAAGLLGGLPTPGSPTASPRPSPTTSPAPLPFGAVLEGVLAWALVNHSAVRSDQPDPTAQAILDALAAEGLISVSGDPTGRAEEAVLLAPPVEQATLQGAKQTPAPSASPDLTPTWTALAAALDAASSGAVVVGPASSAESGGVVAAVRAAPELAAQVSTVDTGGTPMGDLTTVFALREQLSGGVGAYGFGKAAKLPVPAGAS